MKIAVLKDVDGDYWLPYGADGHDRICLTRNGTVDGSAGPVSPDLLAVSEYGPFVAVDIEVTEVANITKVCHDCLHHRHFCYACDDAVEHGHVHQEG